MTATAAPPGVPHRARVAANAGSARGLAAAVVFAGTATAGVLLSAHVARGGPLLTVRWRLLGELAAWGVAWLTGLAAALRLPRRAALPLILLAATAMRLAAIAGPPTMTDDFYRYSWDGRVQAAGVDPYRYPPSAPQLERLREPWLWPEARPCPVAFRPLDCTRINRPAVRTIYPPGAEAFFAAVYRLTGIAARHKPWQVAGLLTDVAVVALAATALRRRGRDPRWVALYGLCPAPVLEIVNNGHVDGLAILLTVAAVVLAWSPSPSPSPSPARRDVGVGALVGLATLVKLYPALLVVPLAAAAPGGRRRSLLRIGGTAAAVVALGYLPHALRVGTRVVGFLPGYLREEQYGGAGRYLLATGLRVPGGLAAVVSAAAVAAAAAWVWLRRPPAPTGAALLLGTLLLAVSPAQPWYAVALLALAALAAEPRWAAVVAAGYPYFFAVILVHPQRVGIGEAAYGVAAAAAVAPFLVRSLATRGRSMTGCPGNGC